MDPVDNNQFEVIPNTKTKRKITAPSENVYFNPALDILANDDPMCNTALEIVPNKKKKKVRCFDIAAFENSALDLGISKTAVNEFLAKELKNVYKNLEFSHNTYDIQKNINNKIEDQVISDDLKEDSHIYENCKYSNEDFKNETTKEQNTGSEDSVLKSFDSETNKELNNIDISTINYSSIQNSTHNPIFINNTSNINLSFIDRLALDSPSITNQTLYLDDDLNESNIMEIKTITVVTKKQAPLVNTTNNTNPFLNPASTDENDDVYNINESKVNNPFLHNESKNDLQVSNHLLMENEIFESQSTKANLVPRILFSANSSDTASTLNESTSTNANTEYHDYENIDSFRCESPIYENIEENINSIQFNKQSKILGQDVSHFSSVDIMNLNKNNFSIDGSSDSNETKKDLKHQINKLSKKVFKTLKKTFKNDKPDQNVTLNPYEVPRKAPKQKLEPKESGIENPALKLDNSDEIEIEDIDEAHQYESIKTIRNTKLNMNLTPLKERNIDDIDLSHRSNTPGKKVRFDSTLNREKIITGDSFDCTSPGFNAKIDKYQDELENCMNERKFLQQHL